MVVGVAVAAGSRRAGQVEVLEGLRQVETVNALPRLASESKPRHALKICHPSSPIPSSHKRVSTQIKSPLTGEREFRFWGMADLELRPLSVV